MIQEVRVLQNRNPNQQQVDQLIRQLSQKLGADERTLRNSAQRGDVSQALSGLKPDDAQKVQRILNDKNAQEKLLSSPQAKELLQKLFEGK